ncbi:MAG: 1-deoxy-D-xylulose-5-phosphate reductoisomerase [Lachnospiraceae bacterium]|nr:1-deoxy-D-xylulose-5-phosphate reductoisomerase [Lachnospiraceae bacterium]
MKRIAILGSTGSIGTQTLDVVRNNSDMKITALAAGHSVDALEKQIREFSPEIAVLYDEKAAEDLKTHVADTDTRVLSGMDGLVEMASMTDADVLVTAVVGMIGIRPTLAGIEAGKNIALANKETLVTAGHLIMREAARQHVRILPVDSEHSAIFQCLHGEEHWSVHKLIITASGGPFRGMKTSQLEHITPEDALKHPTWSMGRKITIDSATLVNKGLEVMEAHWLFNVSLEQIQVVVQPQSIIHSMVEFEDGAVMAQLGVPDMRLPIQYALCYPERRFLNGDRLDFTKLKSIEIDQPDMETFKGLPMAIEAATAGGTMPTVFNAANEEAVRLFLDHHIGFLDIYRIIREAMDSETVIPDPDLDTILATEAEVRAKIRGNYGTD